MINELYYIEGKHGKAMVKRLMNNLCIDNNNNFLKYGQKETVHFQYWKYVLLYSIS